MPKYNKQDPTLGRPRPRSPEVENAQFLHGTSTSGIAYLELASQGSPEISNKMQKKSKW